MLTIDWTSEEAAPVPSQLLAVAVTGDGGAVERRFGAAIARAAGAARFEVGPGDVLWIPAGLPHQVLVPRGGDLNYLAIKSER